jgi:hypothetical protein
MSRTLAKEEINKMGNVKCRIAGTVTSMMLAFLVVSSLPATAGIFYYANYENQDFHGSATIAICCSHSAQIVTSPVRHGNRAVKFTLNSDDQGIISGKWRSSIVRAELMRFGTGYVGDTRWYGLSINIDPTWYDGTRDPNGTIVAQWHRNSDPGESGKAPHLAIMVKGDNWHIWSLSDPRPLTTHNPPSYKKIVWDVGKIPKGQWVDWVVYAKWSYQADGILKIWQNGNLIVSHVGPNVFNDKNPEYVKWGIYKAWWGAWERPATRNTLITYHDEIRIGDASSSYEEVAPD